MAEVIVDVYVEKRIIREWRQKEVLACMAGKACKSRPTERFLRELPSVRCAKHLREFEIDIIENFEHPSKASFAFDALP